MKRLLIAMIFGIGLAICLIGLTTAPAYAAPPNDAKQVCPQFDANFNPAPVAIDTGPGDYNFSGTVVFAQHSTTYVDTGQMPIDTTAPVAMKIDVKDANTTPPAPDQADHPVFDNALAKRYGEQAMLQLRPKSGTSGGGFLRT